VSVSAAFEIIARQEGCVVRKLAIAALVGLAVTAATVSATVSATAVQAETTATKLPKLVKVEDIRRHQENLQKIADYNGGTRASGTPGYDISAKYVADQLKRAGFTPQTQQFEFDFFEENAPSELEQTAPEQRTYEDDTDYHTLSFSGSGEVAAPATAVDTASADSGCEAADFTGFPAGNIAVIKRGTCTFGDKAANAETAGAKAVLIFNDGADPSREGPVAGTLGRPFTMPILGPSFKIGTELAEAAQAGGLQLRVKADTTNEKRITQNGVAETKRGRADNVVMIGAHLDSVPEGPGINDNGSGSGTVLTIAQQITKLKTIKNKVRFAWWAAEESGLIGSEHYVAGLPEAERAKIALYLNFDMTGSPNFIRGVADGDGSTGDNAVTPPAGSGAIEKVFADYYAGRKLPTDDVGFSGRSDYAGFAEAGIPIGSVSSGSDGLKTEEQKQKYGGTVGEQYDPCYHQECDGLDNVNIEALDTIADGAAHATESFALSTLPVNGVELAPKRAAKTREYHGSHAIR
jgi:Zn-dependent M28 family amino/carboxypeptidase